MRQHHIISFGLLGAALAMWWCYLHIFHTINRGDASGIVVVCAIASIFISAVMILSWKRQSVVVRSSRIVRSSSPLSYWLAMFAIALIDLVLLYTLASGLYVLGKPLPPEKPITQVIELKNPVV